MNQQLIRILGGTTVNYPYALESRYPRILQTIMSLWDEDEVDQYFMELMVNERGDRSGFPPDVAADIMHLNLVHASQESPDKARDIWDAPSESFVNFTPRPETDWSEPEQIIKIELQKYNLPAGPEGFFEAAETGNRAAVALFIQAQKNTEIRDNRGWTPLMAAAFNGQNEIIGLLLHHNADVNATDSGGNTALHWAAFGGHSDCAQQLIQHHAKLDAHNNFGWTPLIQATARNHPEVVTLLIDGGVNLDAAADDGYTALHKAAAAGYEAITRLLLERGANSNLQNREGDTAKQLAIRNKQPEIVKLLQDSAEK